MAKQMAIIQVCFNLLDPYQRQLFDRVASFPNRSGYIKRLVQRDMDREIAPVVSTPSAIGGLVSADDFNVELFI